LTSTGPALTVVIPCFNEEAIIEASIERARREIAMIEPSFELVLCNDGSRDNTLECLQRAAQRYTDVKVVSYSSNRGAGYAFRQGLAVARGATVMHMDADLAMEPQVVCRALLPELRTAGIAIASRYKGKRADYPLRRRIPSAIFGLLYRSLLGLKIRDAMSGFFALRREVLDSIPPLESDGFEVYLELFLKALRAGYEISEVGVEFRHKTERGELSVLAYGPKQALNTFRIWRDVRLRGSSRQ
jgi:dolichol-phosphate mannosyltransferase